MPRVLAPGPYFRSSVERPCSSSSSRPPHPRTPTCSSAPPPARPSPRFRASASPAAEAAAPRCCCWASRSAWAACSRAASWLGSPAPPARPSACSCWVARSGISWPSSPRSFRSRWTWPGRVTPHGRRRGPTTLRWGLREAGLLLLLGALSGGVAGREAPSRGGVPGRGALAAIGTAALGRAAAGTGPSGWWP